MKAIDLFCGAGGFSNGFEQAGVDVCYGVDINEAALETFEQNHDAEAVCWDISTGVPESLATIDVDIVFGSPPCKGFSDARGSRQLDDERNKLVFSFIQWVAELQPEYVMMENVAGMTTISDEFLDAIDTEYEKIGYKVDWTKLNAANLGVPQTRERVIYFGLKKDSTVSPSLPEGMYRDSPEGQTSLSGEKLKTWRTVSDAFADLPEPTEDGVVELPSLSAFTDNEF